jgi:sulfur carrier protein ThiS
MFSQELVLGSGFQEDHVIITAGGDTLFNEIFTSQDYRDVFRFIGLPKRFNGEVAVIVNGSVISRLVFTRKSLRSKSVILLDINQYKEDRFRCLLELSYSIVMMREFLK